MIYLIIFSISCLLLFLSNKINNNFVKKSLEFIALLLPCILAGMRHVSIGTDVHVYVEPLFKLSKNATSFFDFYQMSWWDTWHYRYVSDFELFFNVLIYLITKFTNNIQFVLFFIQAFIIFPIYWGIKKIPNINKKNWLAMLLFYLAFYNISYNAMRQFISIAIIFFGVCCLLSGEKGEIKFFISLIIAFFFHKSALLGIIIYIIYKILKDNKHSKFIVIGKNKISLKKLFLIISVVIVIVLIFYSNLLTKILTFLGFDYYTGYISGKVSFNIIRIIKYLPFILMFFLVRKNYFKNENAYFYLLMFILDILISYFSTVNIYASRIGYIFQIFNIIFYIKIIQSYKNKSNKIIICLVLISCMLFLWYYNFIFVGANETYPYISFINE